MKHLLSALMLVLLLTACCRSGCDVWDDTKTCGRHMGRGFKSLGGKHGDSRQVCCREDFLQCEQDYCYQATQEPEFIPVPEEEVSDEMAMVDTPYIPRQPAVSPGDPGSHIPGVDEFTDPKNDAELARVFQTIHFPYNSSFIKGTENMKAVRAIANYLVTHNNVYIFVEGHCDERGAEAYNLALGARRANSVRNLLIKYDVSPEHIYTVSYGKEKPLDLTHTEEAWSKNRRAQFKIYRQ